MMKIYVHDNGVGFDMKYGEKLFGTYQHLHSKSDYLEQVLELVNVQRTIHKHGKHIWAESEFGKGATFYFTI